MAFSELKYKIQSTKNQHKRELALLSNRQQKEMKGLLSQCRHVYDNGNPAKVMWEENDSMQWGYRCEICNCNL